MRSVVDKLVEEGFFHHKGSLSFSVPKIELELHPDETYEGSFLVEDFESRNRTFRGFAYTTHMRMQCLTKSFQGKQAEIDYRFHAGGMEEGTSIKGDICLVTDSGEYFLGFTVTIVPAFWESETGEIKNLFHFANLARMNWEEAVRFFYEPQFKQLFTQNDEQFKMQYEGLNIEPGNESNVEEFLVSIHKKERNRYEFVGENYYKQPVQEDTLVEIPLKRVGWGYTQLSISVDGDFLTVEKERLYDRDFLGNYCSLEAVVHYDMLHAGYNFGKVCIKDNYNELVFEITVSTMTEASHKIGFKKKEVRQIELYFMQSYLEFRTGKQQITSKMKETMAMADKLIAMEEKQPVPRLFQAHMLILSQRLNEAGWILNHVEPMLDVKKKDHFIHAYYLYLVALKDKAEATANAAARYAWEQYREHANDWRYLWLLLYLDEDFAASTNKKLEAIIAQVKDGCRSPMLYVEAGRIYAAEPSLLHRLGRTQIRILYWMLRYGFGGIDLIKQITYLASSVKEYHISLYRLLVSCYVKHPMDEIVSAICALLIKGGRTDAEAYKWYALGIEKELRIIRLYEYYMFARPDTVKTLLPKTVCLYFAYQNQLDHRKKEVLYTNLWQHEHQIPEMLRSYAPQMQEFIKERIAQAALTEDTVYLYGKLLDDKLLSKENAEDIHKIIFHHQIKIHSNVVKGYKKLVAVYKKLNEEQSAVIVNDISYLPIYDSNVIFFLEDSQNGRYLLSEEEYELSEVLNREKMVAKLSQYLIHNLEISLYECRREKHYQTITTQTVESYSVLALSQKVREDYKKDITVMLLNFYYQHDMLREMDRLIDNMSYGPLLAKERAVAIEYMIMRDKTDKALETMRRFGVEHISNKSLVKFCTKMIMENNYEENTFLVILCYHALLGGKYNQTTLEYLVEYFNGSTRQLRFVWKKAEDFEIDTFSLCERMLIQQLFAGVYIPEQTDIFESYVKEGSRTHVELAYLTQTAYEYFSKAYLPEPRIFMHLFRNYEQGEQLNLTCQLALLKYYAEEIPEESYTDNVYKMFGEFTGNLLKGGRYMNFMKQLEPYEPALELYHNLTLVEYQTTIDGRVRIQYLFDDFEKEHTAYKTEYMHKVFEHIYTKSFVLFFGEAVQYYITETADGEEKVTTSNRLSLHDVKMEQPGTRYDMINDICVNMSLRETNALLDGIKNYLKTDYITDRTFTIK